jgi:hypothetical protein
MIVTESFVMLNNPKTGSTFARDVLKGLYAARRRRGSVRERLRSLLGGGPLYMEELILPNEHIRGVKRPPDQHGAYRQIPARHRGKAIVSVVRSPYDRMLSAYEFGWWTKQPQIEGFVEERVVKDRFPSFPDLTLDEFVDYREMVLNDLRRRMLAPQASVGPQTILFVRMFCRDPKAVIARMDDAYVDSDAIFDDLPRITFLRQENLVEELIAFLARHGFSAEETEPVRSKPKRNVTNRDPAQRARLWTPKALDYVATRERLLFRIFERHGIAYGPPDVSVASAAGSTAP